MNKVLSLGSGSANHWRPDEGLQSLGACRWLTYSCFSARTLNCVTTVGSHLSLRSPTAVRHSCNFKGEGKVSLFLSFQYPVVACLWKTPYSGVIRLRNLGNSVFYVLVPKHERTKRKPRWGGEGGGKPSECHTCVVSQILGTIPVLPCLLWKWLQHVEDKH